MPAVDRDAGGSAHRLGPGYGALATLVWTLLLAFVPIHL